MRTTIIAGALLLVACKSPAPAETPQNVAVKQAPEESYQKSIDDSAKKMLERGRDVFRDETFGSEQFWGDKLRLHEVIAGEKHGGTGQGLTPRTALALGLRVDFGRVPSALGDVIKGGTLSFDDAENTNNLLKHDAVVGVKAFYDGDRMVSVGITCALCHSTTDDNFGKGIGRRLDGWPNRDLDVGKVAALAPNLKPIADLLGVDVATVKKVLESWGPGKYDAELLLDGKAFRPDGKSAATLIPAAFGLAGVNLHTYTGWGTVTYWNAYVANTQMHGVGTFFDPRLDDAKKFPLAARAKTGHTRPRADHVTDKLAALHFYQLAIPAPRPPEDSYDKRLAAQGEALFNGKATCARCHVPPLFVEPGYSMHTAEEIGIDDFQALRSPDERYRTTPLRGLFVRAKGGFYHDGRFATLGDVIDHYDRHFKLRLTENEKTALANYLRSL
jgi:mono/diheme cytochrome c family protein